MDLCSEPIKLFCLLNLWLGGDLWGQSWSWKCSACAGEVAFESMWPSHSSSVWGEKRSGPQTLPLWSSESWSPGHNFESPKTEPNPKAKSWRNEENSKSPKPAAFTSHTEGLDSRPQSRNKLLIFTESFTSKEASCLLTFFCMTGTEQ